MSLYNILSIKRRPFRTWKTGGPAPAAEAAGYTIYPLQGSGRLFINLQPSFSVHHVFREATKGRLDYFLGNFLIFGFEQLSCRIKQVIYSDLK